MAGSNKAWVALRSRNFRFFWIGQSFSFAGDRIATIAIVLYVTVDLHDVVGLGLVLGAQGLALAVFLLLGGVWADRKPRKQLIICTDLLCFFLHGGLAILIFSGDVAIWQLVIIEAGFGLAEAVYRPAFAGLLPQTLPEEQIQSGWGLAHASENASMAFGPLIATGLVLGAGAGWAFAADAATFLVSAVTIALVRPRKRGGSSVEAQKSSFVVNLKLGWGEVRRRVWVWASILSTAGLLFLSIAPWFVLAPSVSKANWGTTSYYGIHEAFFGVGTVLGALLAARFRPLRPLRAGYMLMAMWPAQFVLFGLGAPLPLVFSAAFLAGLGMGSFGVFWETCLANWIPPDRLSRVTSWDWLGSVALWPVGLAIAGPIGEALGPRDVVIFAGVAGGLCIALGAIPRQTRALRAGPASDADERAATIKVA